MNYNRAGILAVLRFLEPILCMVLSVTALIATVLALFVNTYLLLLAVVLALLLASFYAVLGSMSSRSP
jgi:hypothetical protein